MGFLDKLKKKAQETMETVQSIIPDGEETAAPVPQQAAQAPAPQAAPAQSNSTFVYDGETYAQPAGWEGLSMEDWFYRLETVKDRMRFVDNENLPEMKDQDGDEIDPEEVLLISEYGFENGGHYEKFRRWGIDNWAAQAGVSSTDFEVKQGGIARERIIADKQAQMSQPGGALDPVQGVSVEAWAQVQAGIAGGGNPEALLASAGIDAGSWAAASAEWMARMSTDTTGAIATAYAAGFAGGGQFGAQGAAASAAGVGGDVGEEPVSYERMVEITCAMDAASRNNQDVNALLQTFGISAMDWSNIGMYWSKKTQQEASKYHTLHAEYQAKYEAKYG